MTMGDLAVITEHLEANADYRRIYMELPGLDEDNLQVSVSGLTEEKARELYAIAREEIADLDFAMWYACLTGRNPVGDIEIGDQAQTAFAASLPASISVSGYRGAQSYSLDFPLYTFLPESCRQYLAWYNEGQAAQDFFRRLSEVSGENYMVSITWYDTAFSGENYNNFRGKAWPAFMEAHGQALRESLESTAAPRMDGTLLRIYVEEADKNGYYVSTDVYCNASPAFQAALRAYQQDGELQAVFTVQ